MFKFVKNLFKKKDPYEPDNKALPPADFFDVMKSKRRDIDADTFDALYQQELIEADKFIKAGQKNAAEHIMFHLGNLRKEKEAVQQGFNKFIFRDDLEFYIKEVSQKVVKIIELESFPRPIPDEQLLDILKAKPYFDELYIVFTDYTGEVERKVKEEDRAKDPIVFGAFKSKNSEIWNHRFYYITDWIDEYCDLTLDKLITDFANSGNSDRSVKSIDEDISFEDLKKRFEDLMKNA